MIDEEGYRANVGIIIINAQGKLFWARRVRQRSWQFPQGGVDEGETALAAMYRELYEEVGLRPQDVEVLGASRSWFKYRLPEQFRRSNSPECIGQKQKWFLLKLKSSEEAICFTRTGTPEFDGWRWVDYWYPMSQVISFKKHVYRRALEFFNPMVRREAAKRKPRRRKPKAES